MAKTDKDKSKGPDKDGDAAGWNFDALPEALRDAARRASDLAQNPYARSLLAAGLVAAAAALASNKKVQKATQRNLKQASEAIEIGADNAGKIGIAMVNAATEAVQRMLNLGAAATSAGTEGGGKDGGGAAAKTSARPAAAKRSTTPRKPRASASAASGSAPKPKTAARKPATSAKTAATAPKTRAKTAAKPAAAKTTKAAAARSPRSRAPRKSD